MGKKGFGSKRRTVLQLNDEPRKQPMFGLGYKASDSAPLPDGSANALSGLMSHYAQDSGTDSDSEDDVSQISGTYDSGVTSHQSKPPQGHLPFQKFVAASDTSALPSGAPLPDSSDHQPVVSKEPKPVIVEAVKAPSDDIDSKLQDFLAEIESIESKQEQTVDDGVEEVSNNDQLGNVAVAIDDQLPMPQALTVSLATSDDDEDFKLSKPREPISKWQQCLDEETQCYYYWHVDTNEVTWEIPAEYSQYLLRFAEYERARANYDSELAEWKKSHPNRKPKVVKKKHRRHVKKAENVCIPIVSYPPEDEEPAEQDPVEGPICGPMLPLIGPVLPSSDASEEKADVDIVGSQTKAPEDFVGLSSSATSVVSSSSELSSATETLVLSPGGSHKSKPAATKKKNTSESEGSNDMRNEISALKDVHNKFMKRSVKSKDRVHGVTSSNQLSNGIKSPPATNIESGASDVKPAETDTSLAAATGEADYNSVTYDDDEYAQKMLEEPVFVRYEFTNAKFAVSADPPGYELSQGTNVDVDPDDIDRELERALERKKSGSTGPFLPHHVHTAEYEVNVPKRKAVDESHNIMPVKKMKTHHAPSSSSSNSQLGLSIQEDVKLKIMELAEVSELAATVTDKLNFLEVNCTDLSKLQILLLQTETRIEDWRAGALSTDHLLSKLRESFSTLTQYEMTATPPGWSCNWHRSYKRYYYRSDVTGEVSWDYPDGPEQPEQPDVEQTMIVTSESEQLIDSACGYAVEDNEPLYAVSNSEQLISLETAASDDISTAASDTNISPDEVQDYFLTNPVVETLPALADADSAPFHPDEPPPPGTEFSVVTARITTKLLSSLVACPPPPPPANPSNASSDERVNEIDMDLTDVVITAASAVEPHDEEAVEEPVSEAEGVISALPVLNRPVEVTSSSSAVDQLAVMSPLADIDGEEMLGSPSREDHVGIYDGIPINEGMSFLSSGISSTSAGGKERKKKKEKALVSGGLALKKKNVSSLVEKWQKVQQDVTEEISKEEHKLKMKKLAATSSPIE